MHFIQVESQHNCKSNHWCQLQGVGLCILLACLTFTELLYATETENSSGYWELGIRSVDVDGSKEQYRQHVNLDNGVWLSGFGWVYMPEENTALTPDRIEISASDLGDQPFQNLQIGIRKYGSYRFNYQRQKSAYFYQDMLIDPADENPEMSNGGDFHHFDFDRVRDQLNFDFQLNDRAKLIVDYSQYTKQGESTTVLDISREEFELQQPLNQKLKNYNLGFEYRWDKVALTFNQRWRDFYNDVEIFLLGSSEGSSVADPTQLDSFLLQQPYGYDSRESQVDVTFRPNENWVIQTDVLYADLDMDLNSLETATGIDFVGDFLQYNLNGEGHSMRTIRQLYVSSAYAITNHMRITASIRDQDLEQNSDLDLEGIASANQWHIDSTTVAVGLETIINNDWTLTGGLTIEDRETIYQPSTVSNDPGEHEQSQSDGYYLILGYRPSNGFSLNFSAEDNIIDDPFTLSSPTNSRRYRLRTGYQWDTGFKLTTSYAWRNSQNDISGWQASSKQTNLRLAYAKDSFNLSIGATLVDIDRSIDQLVTGGFVQVLFPIHYRADSDFWDGLLRWQVTPKTNFMASYRHYDNNGSFAVKRNDARLGLNFKLPKNHSLAVNYRQIDYQEDFEDFDADILEVTFGGRW